MMHRDNHYARDKISTKGQVYVVYISGWGTNGQTSALFVGFESDCPFVIPST